MRNTSISSSIASVVNRVIASVAAAGIAVRTVLHLTFMREHMGYWLEPCQPGFAFSYDQRGRDLGNPQSGYKSGELRHCLLGQNGNLAPAFCTTPTRLASARAIAQQG